MAVSPVDFRASLAVLALALLLSGCQAAPPDTSPAAPPTSSVDSSPPAGDPVGAFVREHMQPASAAFFVPSPVMRDEPVEAVLEVRPPAIAPEALEQEIRGLAGRLGVAASGSIRVAPRMVAHLVADRECAIVPKDPPEQAISLPEGAEWRWTVTPRARGTTRITVTLTTPVSIDGREAAYRVTSFEKAVTVTVTGVAVGADLLAWVKDYWTILAAAVTALGGLWAWLRRRRGPRRLAGRRR